MAAALRDLDDHMVNMGNVINPIVDELWKTIDSAKRFAIEQICALDTCHYVGPMVIHTRTYDLYGKTIEGVPWYIKFLIEKDQNGDFIDCISFHPIKEDLTTNSETLKK